VSRQRSLFAREIVLGEGIVLLGQFWTFGDWGLGI